MKRKIFFRADAGQEIGYGHFIRTLALADMLRDDFDCTFFTRTPSAYQEREAAKICRLVPLPSDDSRFGMFLEYLHGDEIVVLDNYFFTTAYQREIRAKGCTLVCVDDMHDRHYVADAVINHGAEDPSLFSVEPYTRLCLGLGWALLRRPFLDRPVSGKGRCRDGAVVCFGGSDPDDFTGKTVKSLVDGKNGCFVTAVVGDAYGHPMLDYGSRVRYLSRLSAEEMADLFSSAELVVCPASSVCIEALFCGAKVAAGWYVDNQKEFYDYLSRNGSIIPLGRLFGTVPCIPSDAACKGLPAAITDIRDNYRLLFGNLSYGKGY